MPCKFLFIVIFFSEAGERGEGGGNIGSIPKPARKLKCIMIHARHYI